MRDLRVRPELENIRFDSGKTLYPKFIITVKTNHNTYTYYDDNSSEDTLNFLSSVADGDGYVLITHDRNVKNKLVCRRNGVANIVPRIAQLTRMRHSMKITTIMICCFTGKGILRTLA